MGVESMLNKPYRHSKGEDGDGDDISIDPDQVDRSTNVYQSFVQSAALSSITSGDGSHHGKTYGKTYKMSVAALQMTPMLNPDRNRRTRIARHSLSNQLFHDLPDKERDKDRDNRVSRQQGGRVIESLEMNRSKERNDSNNNDSNNSSNNNSLTAMTSGPVFVGSTSKVRTPQPINDDDDHDHASKEQSHQKGAANPSAAVAAAAAVDDDNDDEEDDEDDDESLEVELMLARINAKKENVSAPKGAFHH